jgi:hypothetical protein
MDESFSSAIEVGSTIAEQGQQVLSAIQVGSTFNVQDPFEQISSPIKVGAKFDGTSGVLAGGRYRY